MIGHPDTSHSNNCHSRESNDPFDMTTMTGEVRTGLVVVVSHGRQHSYTCEKCHVWYNKANIHLAVLMIMVLS